MAQQMAENPLLRDEDGRYEFTEITTLDITLPDGDYRELIALLVHVSGKKFGHWASVTLVEEP